MNLIWENPPTVHLVEQKSPSNDGTHQRALPVNTLIAVLANYSPPFCPKKQKKHQLCGCSQGGREKFRNVTFPVYTERLAPFPFAPSSPGAKRNKRLKNEQGVWVSFQPAVPTAAWFWSSARPERSKQAVTTFAAKNIHLWDREHWLRFCFYPPQWYNNNVSVTLQSFVMARQTLADRKHQECSAVSMTPLNVKILYNSYWRASLIRNKPIGFGEQAGEEFWGAERPSLGLFLCLSPHLVPPSLTLSSPFGHYIISPR